MKNKLIATLLILTLFVFGCAKNEVANEQEENINTLTHLTYCNVNDANICVEGFGKDNNNSLIILFKSEKAESFEKIAVYISNTNEEKHTAECYRADEFPENIYCTANTLPESGESIKLDVFDENNSLLGSGNFRVQYGQINFAENQSAPIAQPETSYPNYPNDPADTNDADYPNDTSYPNASGDSSYPNYPNYPNE